MIETKKRHYFLKKLSLVLLCALYISTGINHFWHPQTYVDLIPPYFPNHSLINIVSGICEFFFAILMIFPSTRRLAAYLIIAMLIAFIPAHIYLIQQKGCISKYMCISNWLAWVRLFPFQFVLMWWAWKTYQWNSDKKT